ncbi:hypothetical protein Tco_0145466 [Tanacetum coccineum]
MSKLCVSIQVDHQLEESMVQQGLNQLVKDLLMIVEKQWVLEMLVDESLDMIVDESLDMIVDESLNMIVDESLMVEDKSLVKLMDETLKLDKDHFEFVIGDYDNGAVDINRTMDNLEDMIANLEMVFSYLKKEETPSSNDTADEDIAQFEVESKSKSFTSKPKKDRIIKTKVSKISQNRQRNRKDKTRERFEKIKAGSARYKSMKTQMKVKGSMLTSFQSSRVHLDDNKDKGPKLQKMKVGL